MDKVICYPYIEPNYEWLTVAALCWERVFRITSRHAPPDSDAIQTLNCALNGFLVSVYPDSLVTCDIEERLRIWLAARDKRRAQADESSMNAKELDSACEGFLLFQDKIPYSIHELLGEYEAIHPQVEQIVAPLWDHEWYRSRVGEWIKPRRPPTSRTSAYLRGRWNAYEAKAAKWRREGDGEIAAYYRQKADALLQKSTRPVEARTGFFAVDADVAIYYLGLIATQQADELKADLFAENIDAALQATSKATISEHVVTSLLTAYLPEDLAKLSPERVAAFRNATEKERFKFQKALQSLASDFGSISSEAELERLKRVAVGLANERVEESKKAYRYANIQTITKACGASLAPPALISWLGSTLHIGLFEPTAIASIITLFGVQMLLDRDKAHTDAEKGGWSYVLKAHQHFKSVK